MAILTARGFAGLTQWLQEYRGWTRLVTWTLGLAALGPVVLQMLLLVAIIPAQRHEEIAMNYALAQGSGPPELVPARKRLPHAKGLQTVILEKGNWVGDCKSDITLPGRIHKATKRSEPVSYPPPSRIQSLSHNRITLQYGAIASSSVRLNLRVLDEFHANVPVRRLSGDTTFGPDDLRDGVFTLTADYGSPRQGWRASGSGMLATCVFLGWVARREQRG